MQTIFRLNIIGTLSEKLLFVYWNLTEHDFFPE